MSITAKVDYIAVSFFDRLSGGGGLAGCKVVAAAAGNARRNSFWMCLARCDGLIRPWHRLRQGQGRSLKL